ncbi:putative restriction enzyme [Frankia canadensis]|uniref:Putative restriction enzyme n=1 Tax=Frankia canadensis TaxID=1836972 RepID=A0A2I2L2R1_9ACTN|nr:AAA family ATPase [Frankia canadensis]SNQ52188.1 putative restriction enzyme [Frankia canadensis]SOU59478.1 putative restriction enzyme [Frankia canadensis]
MGAFVGGEFDLAAAVAAFDRGKLAGRLADAARQRERVLAEFRVESWPSLQVERYAQGVSQERLTFCTVLEFHTDALGSIRGGSAAKHIMFRHSSGEWRLAAPLKGLDHREAWGRVRADFVAAFQAARASDFDAIDECLILTYGQALATKSLAIYAPGAFLPIYSSDHLRRFIRLAGGAPEPSATAWRLNRQLRALLLERPELDGWDRLEIMRLLYQFFDPRPAQIRRLKVTPGERAKWWEDCLAGGFIAVGWDEVGDLGDYTSDTELRDALDRAGLEQPGARLALAGSLLEYRDLSQGDRVVAARGQAVLGVGTVTDQRYRFDAARPEGRHLVAVDWDASYAQTLPAVRRGWEKPFAKISVDLWRTIEAGRTKAGNAGAVSGGNDLFSPTGVGKTEAVLSAVLSWIGSREPDEEDNTFELPEDLPELVGSVVQGLRRKGQVLLAGPPGTGKTRLALSVALALTGNAEAISDPAQRQRLLVDLLRADSAVVVMVTFHPSYGYEDFIEGFKPVPSVSGGLTLERQDGAFMRICKAAQAAPDVPYLLIIDEINRGDLPRILGEIVTLLERDKRGLPVRLPVSGQSFAVPPNVFIVGTMNTADRSISHIDAAIRRRFETVRVPPDREAVSGAVGPLDLTAFFDELNRRIIEHLGADHQLGHAYLLRDGDPLASAADLSAAFYQDIIPLLDGYVLGDVAHLRRLLGSLLDPATGEPSTIPADELPARLAEEFTSATQQATGAEPARAGRDA